MKISIYTAVKNGIINDLHFESMLRHHLPLADEIIVNEGFSNDKTYSHLINIDEKIKVFRSIWETPHNLQWCLDFKEAARQKCTGDWCIHLDCDEFIPEWEFEKIRNYLKQTNDILVCTKFINFYGNYKIFHSQPEKVRWPAYKMNIHRNLKDIEFWGDASNVRIHGKEFAWPEKRGLFSVHHFGMVRNAAILRHKWWIQGRAISGRSTIIKPPKFLFKWFPHDWIDAQYFNDLKIYGGDEIKAVRDNPNEFIRDKMILLKLLNAKN
jgi:hypothetical protein